jgi:hypothetical protein
MYVRQVGCLCDAAKRVVLRNMDANAFEIQNMP